MQEFNITIISGCLAVQNKAVTGSVTEAQVFHQILKNKLEKCHPVNVNIKTVKYERLNSCFNKVERSVKDQSPDLLLFQVRGHHYLRLVKLFGKYPDNKGKWRWNINLPFLKSNYEKYLPEIMESMPKGSTMQERLNRRGIPLKLNFIQTINYHLGTLIGNRLIAKSAYRSLIKQVIKLAASRNIPVMFIGVVSRPLSKVENSYSKNLNHSLKKLIQQNQLPYVDIFGEFSDEMRYKFEYDQLHLNSIAHNELAEKLFPLINKLLVQEIEINSQIMDSNISVAS